MLSIHRLSAGDGFRYLLRHTAAGDIDRTRGSSLTSYYAASGYPPGRWLGSGLAGIADGGLVAGAEVTEPQMANLYGRGLDPATGAPLGRAYPVYRGYDERLATRVRDLDRALSTEQRASEIARIEAEERRRRTPNAVAGFDLTFSPVKSVSALWAVADASTQEQIVAAHHEALRDVLALMEHEVAFTRTGSGGVAQVDTQGLMAAAFDHWDTRAGDPQLHTHLVVANRVQGPDGRWRALDGRPMYAATVALSETYNDLLADKLTARLGVDWEHRERGRSRNPAWEISAVPQALLDEFSARTAQIENHLTDLVDEHRESTGREPTRRDMYLLRQQATLMERPHKETPKPLSELVDGWQQRAKRVLKMDPRRVIDAAVKRSRRRPLTSAQVDAATIDGYAATVILAVQQQRATWTRWNVMAEAARQTRNVCMATATDRTNLLNRVTNHALADSISLSAPELIDVPERFRRTDGESVFTVHHADRYTSTTILGAEAYLLDRASAHDAPTVASSVSDRLVDTDTDGKALDDDQAEAVRDITASGRGVDVLVGPAGAGKTTALRALRRVWEAEHGTGAVLGLAPSSTAAEVLAERLTIPTENTAKWLYESVGEGAQRRSVLATNRTPHSASPEAAYAEQQQWQLRAGHLVIVDEASMAGTLDLATLARQANEAGAKILLVGDDAQLSAVGAGGAFRLLAKETNAAELTGVWRFRADWERNASLRLRRGDRTVLDMYSDRGRIANGESTEMADAAYHAWLADTRAGKSSLLLAVDAATVATLNQRARLERISDGEVEAGGVRLHDGNEAGVGDRVVTRLNVRNLADSNGQSVRNGAVWTVDRRWSDGSLTARRDNDSTVVLSAEYVAELVELAYAATVHRAQGATVDTAHVIARGGMSREAFYVSMTRGRDANHAYVVTSEQPQEQHQENVPKTSDEVLVGILAEAGGERSATEIMRQELDSACSLANLVPIHEHMAQATEGDRWRNKLIHAGLEPERLTEVVQSPAWPATVAALRHAEAQGLDGERLLATSIGSADLIGARDVAAVLHRRLDAAIHFEQRKGRANEAETIAGVIKPATHVDDPVMAKALGETEDLIAGRARELALQAIDAGASWLSDLGPVPNDPQARKAWEGAVATVAAYRECHNVSTGDALGPEPDPNDHRHRRDHAVADATIRKSAAVATRLTRSEVRMIASKSVHAEPRGLCDELRTDLPGARVRAASPEMAGGRLNDDLHP